MNEIILLYSKKENRLRLCRLQLKFPRKTQKNNERKKNNKIQQFSFNGNCNWNVEYNKTKRASSDSYSF